MITYQTRIEAIVAQAEKAIEELSNHGRDSDGQVSKIWDNLWFTLHLIKDEARTLADFKAHIKMAVIEEIAREILVPYHIDLKAITDSHECDDCC